MIAAHSATIRCILVRVNTASRTAIWQGQLRAFPLLNLPISHWPISWHIAMGVGICGLFAVPAYLLPRWQATTVNTKAKQLVVLEQQLSNLRRQIRESSSQPLTPLPKRVVLGRLLSNLSQVAGRHDVRVLSVNLEYPSDKAPQSRVTLQLKVSGGYKQIKGWLSQLLVDHPSLVLMHLTMRRASGVEQQIESNLSLSFFVDT